MGFPQEEVKKALEGQKYNQVTAVYLLLGRKTTEVCSLPQTPAGFRWRSDPSDLFSLAYRKGLEPGRSC